MYVICLLFYAIGRFLYFFAYYMLICHRNDRPLSILAFYYLSCQFCLQSYNFFLNYANKSLFFPTSPKKISTFVRTNKLRTRTNNQQIWTAKIARLSHPRLYYI